jgi:hypothetical protein
MFLRSASPQSSMAPVGDKGSDDGALGVCRLGLEQTGGALSTWQSCAGPAGLFAPCAADGRLGGLKRGPGYMSVPPAAGRNR